MSSHSYSNGATEKKAPAASSAASGIATKHIARRMAEEIKNVNTLKYLLDEAEKIVRKCLADGMMPCLHVKNGVVVSVSAFAAPRYDRPGRPRKDAAQAADGIADDAAECGEEAR